MSAATEQATIADVRAHPNRTLAVLALCALAYAFAQTLIVPALTSIQEHYGVSPATATWLLTIFLISSSVCMPLLGRLGDMYGKEKLLLVSLAAFALGSLVAAIGGSILVLILGRAIQGAGGAIFPLAFGIVRDEFPRERVATSIGLISATFGIGGGGGLVLAGVLVDHFSLSSIFWFSLIVTVIAALATWRWIPESPVRVRAPIDVAGAILLTAALVLLLLGISQANSWGWTSPGVLGLVAAGAVVGAAFASYERRIADPLVAVSLMRERAVWSTNVGAFAIGFAMFGSYILIPELVRTAKSTGYGFGLSTLQAGLVMLPSAVVMLFAGPVSGWLGTRYGSRRPLSFGALFATGAYVWLAELDGRLWEIVVGALLIGIGIGLAFAAMANLVVQAVRQDQTGAATGVNMVMRNVGGALGAQISAAILTANTIAGGLPAESGYTGAFLASAGGGLVALLSCAMIPRMHPGHAPARRVPPAPAEDRAAAA
jgi:EmrB/QacA subfamily drug resistance transporter